jgi:hypothetical protein
MTRKNCVINNQVSSINTLKFKPAVKDKVGASYLGGAIFDHSNSCLTLGFLQVIREIQILIISILIILLDLMIGPNIRVIIRGFSY